MPVGQIERSRLFKLFWNTDDPDLAYGGLNEVSVEGVRKLADYARTHNVDGSVSKAGGQRITAAESAIIAGILEDPHYGDYWLQDARDAAVQAFGLPPDALNLASLVNRPTAAKAVDLQGTGSVQSLRALAALRPESLGQALASEYQQRKGFYEDPAASEVEKGRRALGLLKSYADALWARGQTDKIDEHGSALLDAYLKLPFARTLGNQDMSGFGVGAAQSLVMGLNPFKFPHRFPDARPAKDYTLTSLNGGLAPDMRFADAYLEAQGQPRVCEAFEKKSFLGPMIGEEAGNTKAGDLAESTPFGTSGLNWGKVLFPGDTEIVGLEPKTGFEFPIDCLDGFDNTVYMRAGDTLRVIDARGLKAEQILNNPNVRPALKAIKEIEKDAAGKAVAWTAKFVDSQGKEVPRSAVLGLIVTSTGQLRGDGASTGVASMGWYGKCHNYTAQKVFKARAEVKQFDRDVVPVRTHGKVIRVPRDVAQRTFDVYIQNLLPNHTMTGYRFNAEPQQIILKSGERIVGRVQNVSFTPSVTTQNVGADVLAFNNAGDGKAPFNQELEVQLRDGRTRKIPASEVRQILVEMEKSTRFSRFLGFVSANGGVYATDAATGIIVSNGARFVNELELDQRAEGGVPDWAKGQTNVLEGDHGTLDFKPGDKVIWARGKYSYMPGTEATSTAFGGWYQVRDGRIVNEKFLTGEPDFAWSTDLTWDWKAASSDHPHVPPEYVMSLFINGYREMNDEIAQKFQLPPNWRDYRVRDSAVPVTGQV